MSSCAALSYFSQLINWVGPYTRDGHHIIKHCCRCRYYANQKSSQVPHKPGLQVATRFRLIHKLMTVLRPLVAVKKYYVLFLYAKLNIQCRKHFEEQINMIQTIKSTNSSRLSVKCFLKSLYLQVYQFYSFPPRKFFLHPQNWQTCILF